MENVYFGAAKLTLDEITFACRDLLPLDYSWWIAKNTHVSASHATPFQRPSKSQRNGIHCHLCGVPHRLVFVQTCTKSSFYGVPDSRAPGTPGDPTYYRTLHLSVLFGVASFAETRHET